MLRMSSRRISMSCRGTIHPPSTSPQYGCSREKITFRIVLDRDGGLHEIQDVRVAGDHGRLRPRLLEVPDRGDRPGTGVKPNFLWDGTGYVLGMHERGNPARTK